MDKLTELNKIIMDLTIERDKYKDTLIDIQFQLNKYDRPSQG